MCFKTIKILHFMQFSYLANFIQYYISTRKCFQQPWPILILMREAKCYRSSCYLCQLIALWTGKSCFINFCFVYNISFETNSCKRHLHFDTLAGPVCWFSPACSIVAIAYEQYISSWCLWPAWSSCLWRSQLKSC